MHAHEQALWPLTVYYDGSCPLCSAEMRNLMARNQAGRLRFVDASSEAFEVRGHFAAPVSRQQLLERIHAIDATGRVLTAADVFRACYAAVGLPQVSRALQWPVLGLLADRLYPWVADHRHWVPRWLIAAVFERAAGKAARRALAQRCDAGETCPVDLDRRSS